MKKTLLILCVLLISVAAFATPTPKFAIVVYPAIIDSSIEAGDNTPYIVQDYMNKAICGNAKTTAFSLYKDNPYVKAMIEDQVLEESDVELPFDISNADRIAEAMNANGYAIATLKSFEQNEKAYRAKLIINVKIYRTKDEYPIFDKDIKGTYGPMDGYFKKITQAQAFDQCLNDFRFSLRGAVSKINPYKATPIIPAEEVATEETATE